mgnify:CR=1 FL=1
MGAANVTVAAARKLGWTAQESAARPLGRSTASTGTSAAAQASANVSTVSTIPECRADLVARQRALMDAAPRGVVAEGRDITTVVAPDADVRVLLVADPQARVARRAAEVAGKATAAEVTDQVLRRDRDDSTVSNFTDAADGVTVIDSTFLSPDEVVDEIMSLAEAAR